MAYYFAATALPPLALGVKPEMSFQEVMEMLSLNLSLKDMKRVQLLARLIDLQNLKALWLGLPLEQWDEKGNYGPKELEEGLLGSDALPEYLIDYLEKYESPEERLRYFPALFSGFLREDQEEGFLKNYFRLEREIQLVLTALRAKAFGRDIMRELQFEDPQDPFIAYILAQKDAPDFLPPPEYIELKGIFEETVSDPYRLHRSILEYRFKKIEELEEGKALSIDQILGYVARLILVEDFEGLDEKKGHGILKQLSENG